MNTNEVTISFQVYDKNHKKEILDYANSLENVEIDGSIKGFDAIDAIQLTASVATIIQFIDWLLTKSKKGKNIYIRYSSENEEFERLTPDQVRQILDKENSTNDNK